MKTKSMAHQAEALRRSNGKKGFGYLMEQGTGKTWTTLADGERLFAGGYIDAIFIVAPRGVHTNWIRREIPTHMDCDVIARAWRSGAGKAETKRIEELLIPRKPGEPLRLRVFAINIDAISTKEGLAFARKFLNCTKAMFVIDESSRIKNPKAKRTEVIMSLRHLAEYHRILSGTPITNAPMDIFSQMEFLESGLLGTTSYRAFTAEYAELVDYKAIADESPAAFLDDDYYRNKAMLKKNPRLVYSQVVKKKEDGTPAWKNLEKLQALLAPHTFRVLKRDCLDLPDKVYTTTFFDLGSKQMAAYKLLKEELRIILEDETETAVARLAAIVKLQQITSGFVMKPDGTGILYVGEDNPRLDALLEIVEDTPGKIIVWARFKEEIRAISAALRKAGRKVVEYHGGVKTQDREDAVDNFQKGDADVFVGQPQSGGIGLTLTAATCVIYYSNDYNSETRKQSEDRAHRIGTTVHVLYIDIIATDTIDEDITRALVAKDQLSMKILGDNNGARPASGAYLRLPPPGDNCDVIKNG